MNAALLGRLRAAAPGAALLGTAIAAAPVRVTAAFDTAARSALSCFKLLFGAALAAKFPLGTALLLGIAAPPAAVLSATLLAGFGVAPGFGAKAALPEGTEAESELAAWFIIPRAAALVLEFALDGAAFEAGLAADPVFSAEAGWIEPPRAAMVTRTTNWKIVFMAL